VEVEELLFQCLRHFVHLDEANAAIHCASVRYSPITFRCAEALRDNFDVYKGALVEDDGTISRVLSHIGLYEEDAGR